MRPKWMAGALTVALASAAMPAPARASDLKGKWSFGGNLSFLSTTDDIRSNAAIVIGSLGDDGIPNTDDANEDPCTSEGPGSRNIFCDPRPDELIARETSIQETFKYDLNAAFGMTSWLSLQLDVSYFKGKVGPVDAFLRDHFPVGTNPLNPTSLTRFKDREILFAVTAGEITEVPVSLSGVIRFRKDRPLNPFLGAGAGMIFASSETDSDVRRLNARLARMRIRGVANEVNENLVPGAPLALRADGRIPFRNSLSMHVEDAFEWHLLGGAEYFLSERLSLMFDARYTFADQVLTLDLNGEDQINLAIFSEKLFRPDGSVFIYAPEAVAPNPLCSENDYKGLGCDAASRPPEQRVDPEGPNSLGNRVHTCPAQGDFDRDGRLDRCYGENVGASLMGFREPRGDVVVQGGKIDLTGFSVSFGIRFHF